MTERSQAAQELFDEIRRVDNRLRWLGDTLHPELGLTAAKRSILLTLHRDGPQTVPDLARERLVSRQVVQTQVNDLLDEGLVASTPNPRHRRSPLLVLTEEGGSSIRKMLAKEKALVERATDTPATGEMIDLRERLQVLREALETIG